MRPLHKLFVATTAVFAVTACGGGGGSSVPASSGSMASQSQFLGSPLQSFGNERFVMPANVRESCPDTHMFGFAHCTALVRTDVRPDVPAGYGPSALQAAYNLPSSTDGKGNVVAIVDAFDDPNVESDLAFYRKTFGLPVCSTKNGCFSKVNQEGKVGSYPTGNEGWGEEISLDVDMVSAGCPNCKILLVEANSNGSSELGASVNEAIKLGADIVSNSYDGGGLDEADYTHPGKIILASAGDGGYGIAEPAGFPSVIAVGGTSLRTAKNTRGYTETVWGGTGSGCSTFPKPKWQGSIGCSKRVADDASAVADPDTGVTVYDTYGLNGFAVFGGTSVSSPFLGSVYGLAGNASKLNYGQSLWVTKNHKYLYDVTSGSNGNCNPKILCTGGVGWDGPTGWGTPNGIGAF